MTKNTKSINQIHPVELAIRDQVVNMESQTFSEDQQTKILENQRAEIMKELATLNDVDFLSFMSQLCTNMATKPKEQIEAELSEYRSTLHPDHTKWTLSFIRHYRDHLAGQQGGGY